MLISSRLVAASNFGLQSHFLDEPYKESVTFETTFNLSTNNYIGLLSYGRMKFSPKLYLEYNLPLSFSSSMNAYETHFNLFYLMNDKLTMNAGISLDGTKFKDYETIPELYPHHTLTPSVNVGAEYMFLRNEDYSLGARLDLEYFRTYFPSQSLERKSDFSWSIFLLGKYSFNPQFDLSGAVGYVNSLKKSDSTSFQSTQYIVAAGATLSYRVSEKVNLYLDMDYTHNKYADEVRENNYDMTLSLSNIKRENNLREVEPKGYFNSLNSPLLSSCRERFFDEENPLHISEKLLANYAGMLAFNFSDYYKSMQISVSGNGSLSYIIYDKLNLNLGAYAGYHYDIGQDTHSIGVSLIPALEYEIDDKLSLMGYPGFLFSRNSGRNSVEYLLGARIDYLLKKDISLCADTLVLWRKRGYIDQDFHTNFNATVGLLYKF